MSAAIGLFHCLIFLDHVKRELCSSLSRADMLSLREDSIGEVRVWNFPFLFLLRLSIKPLSTYFTHGLGNQPSRCTLCNRFRYLFFCTFALSDASLRGPVLLAGINTQRQTMASLDGRLRGAKMTQSAIGTLGQHDGEIATHMVSRNC